MRKTKEILRLKLEVGLSNRKVAEGSGVGRTTVSDYAKRARRAGLDWAEIERLSEAELNRRLFPPLPESKGGRPRPDLRRIHQELRKKSVTLALLWDEYKARHPDGYQYSYFCDLYRDWIGRVDPVMRQSHKAGGEGLCGLRRPDHRRGRRQDRRGAGGPGIRGRFRGQQLHLRRGDLEPGAS